MRRVPFYHARLNDWVVDGMCKCGHLHSEHGSLLIPVPGAENSIRIEHDGSCCEEFCTCEQFTWQRFVTAEEFALLIRAKRVHKTADC